ncbi:isoprenylcysteine carboxylmethyltransferase family protein [Longimicrobium sp.]|uniref:methyltransferase family protein n=1 Tax=Longimicrobium sp. TaxID=2029185 RepID=UPI002B9236B6|nr:isoprenylcysteine carboxylmethyltransferase family protein [Longimicrobium sp.]HSU15163.1 isoprenylcysteine carboxylmethyltransferase family protein [Longimicrobium sp.]
MERKTEVPVLRFAVSIVGMLAVFGMVLFGSAGTLAWPEAWLFLALFSAFTVAISAWLMRHDPALLAERITGIGSAGQKRWDKIFILLANVAFIAWLALMALDAVRFRWSHVPVWVQGIGAAMLIGSFWLFFLVYRENSFLSPAVRIQTERKQTVVSTGPYARVRHPMYAAAIPLLVGTALMLGSRYGVAGGMVVVAMIAWRALREERVLAAELPGYAEYMRRVRFRFIPGVW